MTSKSADRVRTLLAFAICTMAPAASLADEAARSITELPTLGGKSAIARGINQHGTVVGESHDGRLAQTSRDARAAWKVFIMPRGGPMQQLEQFAGLEPMLINDHDVVVGERFSANAQRYAAFMWTRDEGTINLPAPPGEQFGHPVGLDNAGNVLMNADTGDDARGYFLNRKSGSVVRLPCLPDHTCRVTAMNEAGAIVGVATKYVADEYDPARKLSVLWAPGGQTLAALPNAAATEPVAINARGTILGVRVEDDAEHVVVWRGPAHERIDLGIGVAVALNNHDVATGMIPGSAGAGPSYLPALWDLARSARISLPPLTPQDDYVELADINDAGDVVGTAYDADGDGHIVLYRGYAPALVK